MEMAGVLLQGVQLNYEQQELYQMNLHLEQHFHLLFVCPYHEVGVPFDAAHKINQLICANQIKVNDDGILRVIKSV